MVNVFIEQPGYTRSVNKLKCAFTKPPLLQESRLTGGGSPNLVEGPFREIFGSCKYLPLISFMTVHLYGTNS